jgi:hypothetical protein
MTRPDHVHLAVAPARLFDRSSRLVDRAIALPIVPGNVLISLGFSSHGGASHWRKKQPWPASEEK